MASCKVEELPSDTKDSSTLPEQLYQGSHYDITEELQPDSANAVGKPQKSGRFRRTALTFFGVRKSICILPSFFGGRNKNPIKWSSKKGFTKSRTHDGLSKFSHDDRSGYMSAGDFEYCCQRDAVGELQTSSHSECSPAADQKSLTFTRQKKGLRGLFSSFKYHRNHRNIGLDKTEVLTVPSSHCNKAVPVNQESINQYVTECLRSEPDVPACEDILCDASSGPECIEANGLNLEEFAERKSPKTELCDQPRVDQVEMNLVAFVSAAHEENSVEPSKACLIMSEPVLESETPGGSSDQLNLIFGDVASLKSFDSLTGCGDIIADQEDDSITDSTVSGERSRNGGKRASCYLTYQGGGEDMALPDDLDEQCLHDFWENDTSEEMCYTCSQEHTELTADLTSSHNMNLLNSNSTQQPSGTDTSSADMLTPQSEHQESVPNSDEGYYDSTTPGPDEGQEKNGRLKNDRLPRDSYSGDALYELFVPDESLISPHYENKATLPGSNLCQYLGEALETTDSTFVMDMNQLHIGAELYKIQNFLERPGACGQFKELAKNVGGRQEVGVNKNCSLNSKLPGADNKNNTNPDRDRNSLASPEKRQKPMRVDCEKRQSSISFGSTSDTDFETFCEPKEQHLEENKPVALPYRNISSLPLSCSAALDHGQTVCFSQALEDYTKHSQMLSHLQTSVDDLETNSAFTPHVQALPSIVTFDVVDLHNEGEYDEQIHMELEEDISSPFQEFEESYLQKDAFAECDFQMLDVYEQNMISQTWAVASLPRHLGLTRVSQGTSNPLSLDRRSRSLDTESLELKSSDAYREDRAAILSCSRAETDSETHFSPDYKQNVLVSTSEVRNSSSIMASSWYTRSALVLSLPLVDGEITERVKGQTPVRNKIHSSSSSGDFTHSKLHLCSNASDRASCELKPQDAKLYSRKYHCPLQSESASSHNTFVYSGMMEEASDEVGEGMFCQNVTTLQSYNPRIKGRTVTGRDGLSHSGSPVKSSVSKEDTDILSETKTHTDVAACSQLSEASID